MVPSRVPALPVQVQAGAQADGPLHGPQTLKRLQTRTTHMVAVLADQ